MAEGVFKTVVFSGGRGTRFIQQALSGVNNASTTYVINGYDSGLSTGATRRSVEGLLGPSDFRKAIVNIALASTEAVALSVAKVLDSRLPMDHDEAFNVFRSFESEKYFMRYLSEISDEIPISVALEILSKLEIYREYLGSSIATNFFSPSDLAIGNAFFAGAFIEHGDFQKAIDASFNLTGLGNSVSILNVTQGEDLWLTAISESGLVCVEEGHFVSEPLPDSIAELFLISREGYFSLVDELGTWRSPQPEQLSLLKHSRRVPNCNEKVKSAIAEADLVIYGTGTLHSSLLPTYLTTGLPESIVENKSAKKILMVNGDRDIDVHGSLNRSSSLDSTLRYLNPSGNLDSGQLISEVWVTSRPWDDVPDCFTDVNEYSGFAVLELAGTSDSQFSVSNSYTAISATIARSLGSRLAPSEFVASIVIPVLNEVDRLDELFREIDGHAYTPNGAFVEYIFVDGGSTDGSFEKICSHVGSVHLLVDGSKGRQAAIGHGILNSRGSTVGVFHSDLEYALDSFMEILGNAERGNNTLYIASRSHGAGSELNLKRIYGSRNVSYWLSRFGGIAVATFLSLRIGRVVSDPLSGVYASGRELLMSHSPLNGEIDGFVRTIRNCAKASVSIVEMGIRYAPRRRQDGKKTSVGHGLRALISAFL